MGTFVEKILNAPAGSIVVRRPNIVMSHDNSARIRKIFEEMGGKEVNNSAQLLVVLDRKMTGTTDELIRDYNSIHCFMNEQKVEHFFDCDKGICHEILTAHLKPGWLIVGNDSHTCTAGAFNCMAVGLNKTETALLWKEGKIWFRVPETIKIILKHRLSQGVYAKDLALWMMGMLREESVAYKALEFHGEGVHTLSIADRMTVANVAAEIGLKSVAFPPDDRLADYFGDYAVAGVWADDSAVYYKEFEIDLAQITPLVMRVDDAREIKPVCEWGHLEVRQGLIGACASGRLEDLRVVARILEGRRIVSGFQLSIVPASREVYLQAVEEGLIDKLVKAGASILGSSCGPCLGSSHMIMADTRRFITTVNSNSMQRLSAIGVEKYIASPATIAVTALKGVLTGETEQADQEYPYWEMPKVWVTVSKFERRYNNRVWNYGDLNSINCGQLLAESCTYPVVSENFKTIRSHLLEGLDTAFAGTMQPGDVILGGENFGCGILLPHAVVGLKEAGIKAVIVKSVNRRFFRMAANHGLWVIVLPDLVEKYHTGDEIEIDFEDKRAFLGQEKFILPAMEPEYVEMIRNGGIY